jgi:hypothetical protein
MRMRHGFLRLLVVAAVLGLPADYAIAQVRDVTIRDSAGIRIVENRAPAWGPGPRWRVASSPRLSIGQAEGDPAYQLYGVRGASRLSDGRIVVLNSGVPDFRIYDKEGRHLRTIGRRGEGPGEFQFPIHLLRLHNDSLVVWDDVVGPASVFSGDGRFIRQERLDVASLRQMIGSGRGVGVRLPLQDKAFIVEARAYITPQTLGQPGVLQRPPVGFYRIPPDLSRADSLGWFPGYPQLYFDVNGVREYSAPLFPANAEIAAGGTPLLIFAGNGSVYEISVFDSTGRLTTMIRRSDAPQPIPPEAAAAERARRLRNAERRGRRPAVARLLTALPEEKHFPAFQALIVDEEGYLWVKDRGWSVYDRTGRWLGTMNVPSELWVVEIGSNYILGIRQDAFDVEHVVLYDLVRDGAERR